jgi:hypothetical protein
MLSDCTMGNANLSSSGVLKASGLILSVAVAALSLTKPAEACSGCVGQLDMWPPHQGSIPANATTLFLTVPGVVVAAPQPFGIQNVSLTQADSSEPLEFELMGDLTTGTSVLPVRLQPTDALEPSSEYTVTVNDVCGVREPRTFSFRTTTAAPLPATLGAMTVSPTQTRDVEARPWPSSGMCSAPRRAAVAGLRLDFAPEAAAWKDLLVIETLVNGGQWEPGSMLTRYALHRGVHSIHAFCDPAYPGGLALGTHTVMMRATLPGSDIALETPAVNVNLACAPEGAGGSSGSDAGTSGTSGTGGTPDDDGNGCSFAATATSSSSGLVMLLALLGLLRRRSAAASARNR